MYKTKYDYEMPSREYLETQQLPWDNPDYVFRMASTVTNPQESYEEAMQGLTAGQYLNTPYPDGAQQEAIRNMYRSGMNNYARARSSAGSQNMSASQQYANGMVGGASYKDINNALNYLSEGTPFQRQANGLSNRATAIQNSMPSNYADVENVLRLAGVSDEALERYRNYVNQ